MTRGKYAAKATLRREDAGVRSEIDGYQHHVQRLTGENKRLAAERSELLATHKKEVHKLRAMLDEGLSPELLALRKELELQRERAARAEATTKRTREIHEGVMDFTASLLRNLTGCTGLEAMEVTMQAVGVLPGYIADSAVGADRSIHGQRTAADVHTLQRVRGFRSSPKVIDHLLELAEAARARAALKQKPAKVRTRTAS